MKHFLAIIISAILVSACGGESDGFDVSGNLTSEDQKLSYAIGYQVGTRLNRDSLPVDPKLVAAGVHDAMSQTTPQLDETSRRGAILSYQKKRGQAQGAAAAQNAEAGKTYRDTNMKKEGVSVLPSGVQYKVITAGKGKKPKPEDTVVVHYRGSLVDGKEFDSSYSRNEPATFGVSHVIRGWQEVLVLMKEGAKWQVVIPPEMAYGPTGAGALIGPNATLVFDIELIKIKPAD
ncbi:MAG TPA: FKBP-type peptidyl-prolyl cis-trans isomerase [Acidiferrobacteraceae bacterium]|nr:FKBP-type peptidyl-prolyl cis-trans isomerase [Acidiferrobacteraceae bacterium]